MHMADALISPAVGGTMWAVSGGVIAVCARKVRGAARDNLVPMMGVLGAFVFAAQMINFAIPATGSSGHLGGGLLLAVMLGPQPAFLVIASVLAVQALFFADGGLLALGCNMFNLGFIPVFVAYPLVYRVVAGRQLAGRRLWAGSVAAAIAGFQLGSFAVVVETKLSGISELPFAAFLMMMQPVHLAIGAVEGLATAAVVGFVAAARPEAVAAGEAPARGPRNLRPVYAGLLVCAGVLACFVSWFASTHPDGLEWSVARVMRSGEPQFPEAGIRAGLARVQEKTAVLPDYGFRDGTAGSADGRLDAGERQTAEAGPERWPAVSAGTSVSGLVGGLMTLAAVWLAGLAIRAGAKRRRAWGRAGP